eukprot:558308-Amphidinium_carterae.1
MIITLSLARCSPLIVASGGASACSGTEKLVHDDQVVPVEALVRHWPAIQPPGEISEYQLVA